MQFSRSKLIFFSFICKTVINNFIRQFLTIENNALAAYAVGSQLEVEPKTICQALSQNDEKVFGRQEVIDLDGKEVTMILDLQVQAHRGASRHPSRFCHKSCRSHHNDPFDHGKG